MDTSELAQITEKLHQWWLSALSMIPNVVLAVIILVIAVFVGRLVGRAASRGLGRTGLGEPLVALMSSLARLVVLVLGFLLALNTLELTKAVATAIVGVGVLGLALGFAFQDIAANFMSGIIMAFHPPFAIGDVIETNGFMGTVVEIGMRETRMRKFTGELVLIPNSKVFSEVLVNISAAHLRRVHVAIGVSYDDDLDAVESIVRETVEGLADRDASKGVDVVFMGFGDSSIDLEVRFWVDYHGDSSSFLRSKTQAIKAIKRAFDAAGISIPFPIRTLDFGDAVPQAFGGPTRPAAD